MSSSELPNPEAANPSQECGVPRTWIVVHPRENRRKCSVEPLRVRPDFYFVNYRNQDSHLPPAGYLRLGLGGPLLTGEDAGKGLLILDATWRLAGGMEETYRTYPVRSIPAWKTAYPRVSKVFQDPLHGLATIEAVYAAYIAMDRDPSGLLDHYYWKDEFLSLNRDFLPVE